MSKKTKIFLILNNSNKDDEFSNIKRILSQDNWQIVDILNIITLREYINKSQVNFLICLFMINPIDYDFTINDLKYIEKFCEFGHSILIASNGFDESKDYNLNEININYITNLLFGVKFNQDCVIRPNPIGNYHPKEVKLEDFIVNRGLKDVILRNILNEKKANQSNVVGVNNYDNDESDDDDDDDESEISKIVNDHERDKLNLTTNDKSLRILYANGCSLTTVNSISSINRSIIMMTSSKWSLPNEQCICTFYKPTIELTTSKNSINDNNKKLIVKENCRIILIGSYKMFSDYYLDKELNRILFKSFINFIEDKNFPINIGDARTIELPKYFPSPDINQLLNIPICCLKEPNEIPKDRMELVSNNNRLFNIDCSMLPTISKAFNDLEVNYEPLTLIKPKLELKPFKLKPATFGFLIKK